MEKSDGRRPRVMWLLLGALLAVGLARVALGVGRGEGSGDLAGIAAGVVLVGALLIVGGSANKHLTRRAVSHLGSDAIRCSAYLPEHRNG